jgi:hypothetical protein
MKIVLNLYDYDNCLVKGVGQMQIAHEGHQFGTAVCCFASLKELGQKALVHTLYTRAVKQAPASIPLVQCSDTWPALKQWDKVFDQTWAWSRLANTMRIGTEAL